MKDWVNVVILLIALAFVAGVFTGHWATTQVTPTAAEIAVDRYVGFD